MLTIKNLSKSYRGAKALENVSFTLHNGLYGLLGPNGAGKSTLMNLITDNLLPDSGEILWDGTSTRALGADFRRILGYTPQQQGLYPAFTGRRFLTYLGTLKEIPKRELSEEVERTAALVNLSDQLDKRLSAYSGGMKQRILTAQALLGSPRLLILDEPTAGLDPKERVSVRELLRSLARDRIVLVATHVVSDVEQIADEIIFMKNGRIAAKAAPELLIGQFVPGGTLEEAYLHLFGGDAT